MAGRDWGGSIRAVQLHARPGFPMVRERLEETRGLGPIALGPRNFVLGFSLLLVSPDHSVMRGVRPARARLRRGDFLNAQQLRHRPSHSRKDDSQPRYGAGCQAGALEAKS